MAETKTNSKPKPAKKKARKTPVDVGSMIKRLISVAVGFMLLGLVFSAVEWKRASNSKAMLIDITEVNGQKFINAEDVNNIVIRRFGHTLEGVPLGALNVKELERVLEEDAMVLNADVFIDAENRIHTKLTQREPIMRIVDKMGKSYYLDNEGFKMPLSAHATARVIVASGQIPSYQDDYKDIKNHSLINLFDLVKYIQADDFLDAQIEQIYMSENNEFTLVPKIGKHKIIFGKIDDMVSKFKHLKTFYKEALPYEGWNKYKSINLKYKGQVVCKKS